MYFFLRIKIRDIYLNYISSVYIIFYYMQYYSTNTDLVFSQSQYGFKVF